MRSYFVRGMLTILLFATVSERAAAAEKVDFNRDIRPTLAEKCFQCHGPDEDAREAGLRLDVADAEDSPFDDRDGSRVIAPGDLAASGLWYRLTTDDEDEAMPPKDANIHPLTDAQRELFKRWILQGAEYQNHWAFVPLAPQRAPVTQNTGWTGNRIDRFVMARLEAERRQPQPQADKRTLIRRVTFDLTGLPPTRDEIRQFVDDRSQNAYERLVDRLITSPKYGEHMAKYWLDLVRFADTNGIHHDHYREMTPYRDWVVRSYNDNLSFDRFISDQIAGDLFDQPTLDQQIASGFNRLHLVIDRGTALPAESFTRNVIDRVTAVGTAFMGLTVGCAVCHDHKYDPLTQSDFYQLYAFFNNIDSEPETPGQGVHPPFVRVPSPSERERLQAIDVQIARRTAEAEALQKLLDELENNESDAGSASARDSAATRLNQAKQQLEELHRSKQNLENAFPVSLVMKERTEIRPAHILIRGAYDQPGPIVARGTPAFLPPLSPESETPSRLDLARWLTDDQHPLTARVTVNRYWQQFFGVGLVKTSEDFGTQGEWPSHPRLLDDLAIRFVRADWDVKALVRSIVCSQTYRQSSKADPDDFQLDPDNRLLARGSRFRLDAEMIRDQILSVSGLLNQTMYGKSVKPPQPPNLWKNVSMVSSSTYAFKADTGGNIYRRSLYSFWKRALPPPQMTIFDAPTRESCVARRERTNTPLQALVLMNEGQFFSASKQFAARLLQLADANDAVRLSYAYESVTSHLPDAKELASLSESLDTLRQTYRQDLASAKALTGDMPQASDRERIELAAHTMLINSLFNLDVTKTRE